MRIGAFPPNSFHDPIGQFGFVSNVTAAFQPDGARYERVHEERDVSLSESGFFLSDFQGFDGMVGILLAYF